MPNIINEITYDLFNAHIIAYNNKYVKRKNNGFAPNIRKTFLVNFNNIILELIKNESILTDERKMKLYNLILKIE